MKQSNVQIVSEILALNAIQRFGFTHTRSKDAIAKYESWLEKGYYGSMEYLKRHLKFKKDPELPFAIVMALPYFPHPRPKPMGPLSVFRIATYARGLDYHDYIKDQLDPIVQLLQKQFLKAKFQVCVDSSPVLERDLAMRAGLGWFGKNTCLIHEKHGSLFFIAEILTDLDLSTAQINIHPDRCGTCNRCIEACPTDAIVKPYVIDATKCISYLTIEKKGDFSEEESRQIGDWLFGCDICQTVCPWNEKVFGKELMQTETTPSSSAKELRVAYNEVLELKDTELENYIKNTPLSRSKARGIRRNLSVIANNLKLSDHD